MAWADCWARTPLEIDLDVARRGGMEVQQLRAEANAPIQGSSADVIKVAIMQLQAALRSQALPARLLLQVQDVLALEVDSDALETTRALVKSTMGNAGKLNVPLLVDVGIERTRWKRNNRTTKTKKGAVSPQNDFRT